MSGPSKIHTIPLVEIQPEERLAATSERNLASSLVTGCSEAKGMGYWAATQVNGFCPEIHVVPEADAVHLTEGCTLILPKPRIDHFYTLSKRSGCTPEEPDEGRHQVLFCEEAHSNSRAITPMGGGL